MKLFDWVRSAPVRRAALGIAACGAGAFVCLGVFVALPIPASVLDRERGTGVTIEDRGGLLLRSTRSTDGSRSAWVPIAQIDPDLINAFVAVEDRRFWDHHGVDPLAIARAIRDNVEARRITSGASTIPMQLGRLLAGSSRNWLGKGSQVAWALRLEAHLDKQRILEEYLNRVQLGQGVAGVGSASALYFGRSASELSIGQAATLAGMAHAPSRDNPMASLSQARARRAVALTRMRKLALITREDAARARLETVSGTPRTTPFLAPHFTSHVLAWTEDGAGQSSIRTSLDLGLQRTVEEEVRHTVDVMHDRGVAEAAAVVLDNRTGEVRAWVGSPDFWEREAGQTDMVVSERQPGSALKPFLYGMAFDRGVTAATVLADIPTSYATPTGPYSPRNYDRHFRGPVRAREALASSYNVPAVELASRMSTTSLLQTLHLAGFESLRHGADYYGLGLALGNGDVTLIELANAYRALANDGEWSPWTWRPYATSSEPRQRVMSPLAGAIVLDILADPTARVPGFGVVTPFDFPFPTAVKTGTSRHFTDNWAVATTRGFTVAVWAGNFDGRPMEGVSGVSGAGPLLHRVVMATAQRIPAGELIRPAERGAVAVEVCRLSGLRATDRCPTLTEWFKPGTEPGPDTWQSGGGVTLPAAYAAWTPETEDRESLPGDEALSGRTATGAVDSLRAALVTATPSPMESGLRIVSPRDGDHYAVPVGVEARYATIPLRASGATGVEWRIDGRRQESDRWRLARGAHVIEAVTREGQAAKVRVVVDP